MNYLYRKGTGDRRRKTKEYAGRERGRIEKGREWREELGRKRGEREREREGTKKNKKDLRIRNYQQWKKERKIWLR